MLAQQGTIHLMETKKQHHTPHDAAYKQLFSDPEMVASLLRDLIPEKFVAELYSERR